MRLPDDPKILRTVLDPFDFTSIDPMVLQTELIEVMKIHKGVGLAANQVNINARVFVMVNEGMYDYANSFGVFNPEILEYSPTKVTKLEGCLSYPGLYLRKERHEWIRVRYFTHDRVELEAKLDGYLATIFQHEFEHLNGIVFTDGLSKLKLDMARKKTIKLMKKLENSRG